jgi:hypothetical protein
MFKRIICRKRCNRVHHSALTKDDALWRIGQRYDAAGDISDGHRIGKGGWHHKP